jgi:hypothetical protein
MRASRIQGGAWDEWVWIPRWLRKQEYIPRNAITVVGSRLHCPGRMFSSVISQHEKENVRLRLLEAHFVGHGHWCEISEHLLGRSNMLSIHQSLPVYHTNLHPASEAMPELAGSEGCAKVSTRRSCQ